MKRSMVYGIAALSLFGCGVLLDMRAHLIEMNAGEKPYIAFSMEEYRRHAEFYIPSTLASIPFYLMYRELRKNKKGRNTETDIK
jgi:hypothetical protein